MNLRENISLAPYTSFHVGGAARFFIEVQDDNDLVAAVEFAERNNLPIFILGGGTNVLIADDGFAGVVLCLKNTTIAYEHAGGCMRVVVGAGTPWDTFVAQCVEKELWGLENLSGIPGVLGASVVQNIGAYGKEVREFIETVEVYDIKTKTFYSLTNAECHFGYRQSIFKHEEGKSLIVVRVTFLLALSGELDRNYKDVALYEKNEQSINTVADMRRAICIIRGRKFPGTEQIGTAGSFFKNPIVDKETAHEFLSRFPEAPNFPADNQMIKLSAAWIIDNVLQMKGVRVGNVGMWEAQALVLINYGGASAHEIKSFAMKIIDECKNKTHITLIPEVVYVGDEKL